VPDPDRARALITYARAIIFLSKRLRNPREAKRNPDMSVTDWAAFVSVILQSGHSALGVQAISRALLSSTLHHVTVFATINDLYTGRQKPPPGTSFDKKFILTSFKTMMDPLVPVLTFQSAAGTVVETAFLVVLNGRDCELICSMVLNVPSLTSIRAVSPSFRATRPSGRA
jgi:hypothetical protein